MNTIALLGRKYSTEILAETKQPMTVGELHDNLGAPIATCYRRVNELTEAGLLTEHTVNRNRSGVTQFQRTTDEIDIRFTDSISVCTHSASSQRSAIMDILTRPFERLNVTGRLSSATQRVKPDGPASSGSVCQKPTKKMVMSIKQFFTDS